MGIEDVCPALSGTSYDPGAKTLAQIYADINSSQVAFNTAEDNVRSSFANYSAARESLSHAIDTGTGIPAAVVAFQTQQIIYNQRIDILNRAACVLVNQKNAAQHNIDGQTNSVISTSVTNLLALLSQANAQELVIRKDTRETALVTLNNILATYRVNEASIAKAREDLLFLRDQAFINYANAAGHPPTDPEWTTYQSSVQAADNQQVLLDGYVAMRSAINSDLDAAVTAFETATSNLNSFVVSLSLSGNTDAAAIINATSDTDVLTSPTNIQHIVATNRILQITDDEIAEQQHFITNKVDTDALDATVASLKEQLVAGMRDTVSTIAAISGTSDITFPVLTPGRAISISDLMRFIVGSQLLLKQITQASNETDAKLNDLRTKLWKELIALAAIDSSTRLEYYSNVVTQDTAYNDQVSSDNAARLNEQISLRSNFNGNVSAINVKIDEENARIDILNQTLSDPVPHIPHVIPLFLPTPDFQSNPPPTQTAIDNYNDLVILINQTVAPIMDKITGSPINFTPIPLLSYRGTIAVRDFTSTIDTTVISTALSALFELIKREEINKFHEASEDSRGGLSKLRRRIGLEVKDIFTNLKTTESPPAAGTASDVSVFGSVGVKPSKIGSVINRIVDGGTFKSQIESFLERASIVSGAQQATVPQTRTTFTLGIPSEENVDSDLQAEKDKGVRSDLLLSISEQLLSSANNYKLLEGNAILLASESKEAANLSPDEARELVSSLVALQQILLVLVAALSTIASVVPVENPVLAAQGIRELIGRATGVVPQPTPEASPLVFGVVPQTGVADFEPSIEPEVGVIPTEDEIIAQIDRFIDAGFAIPLTVPEIAQASGSQKETVNLFGTFLPTSVIETLREQLVAGKSLEEGLNIAFANVPSLIVSGLNDRIGAFAVAPTTPTIPTIPSIPGGSITPIPVSEAISAIAEAIPSFNGLKETDKAPIALAVSNNVITLDQANKLVSAINSANKGTLDLTETHDLLSEFEGVSEKLRTDVETRTDVSNKTVQIDEGTVRRFQLAITQLSSNESNQKYVDVVGKAFAEMVEKQTDFFKFSVSVLLDPGMMFTKLYSGRLSDVAPGKSSPVSTNIMG